MSILKKQDKEDMFENLNFVKFQLDLKYLVRYFFGQGVTITRYLQDKFIEQLLLNQKGKILELGGNVDFATSLMLQRRHWHADFCHLDNKAGIFNHLLSTFYLIKGFLSPICYWDDYATMFGVVAKK